jgi:alpha-N-arabinofuranosidase
MPTTFQFGETDSVKISPRLYGHFAEHLGRCCYGGLWVGPDETAIPHRSGFRTDLIDKLREMPTPLLRWPGGCYADHYHWRDGIGDPSKRLTRLGLSCGKSVLDDNGLGTHEFIALCRELNAEPYLAGNMGSGSVQELCDWVEYCNSTVPTSLVRERHANGSVPPFGVKLWGVGNENWGCGGEYDPESYGLEYRRYASMIKHVEPCAELVACGHDHEWNKRLVPVLKRNPRLVDHYSIHRYWINGGPATEFTEDQYYRAIREAQETEDFILETRALLDEIDPERRIGIALDEWGVWHPEARPWGPDGMGDLSDEYFQAGTQRDAIQTAVALEVFHRQAAILSLTNLAQIVNVLHAPIQTAGEVIWTTPTYHVLKMHKPHIGQRRLPVTLECELCLPDDSTAVSATASEGENGTCLTVVNRSYDRFAELRLPEWARSLELLSAPPAAVNSQEDPERVKAVSLAVPETGLFELPPSSILSVRSVLA